MSITLPEALAQRIYNNPNFQQDFCDLLKYGFAHPSSRKEKAFQIENIQLMRLAECALILATSPNDSHNRMSFEVTTILYERLLNELPGLGGVTKLICARMGNTPAVDLLNPEMLDLPPALEVESQALVADNMISIGKRHLKLTKFQHHSFELLSKGISLSLSAPTSAGKSFLITHFVANQFANNEYYTAVIIVPTRALIRQLIADFNQAFSEYRENEVPIGDVVILTSSFEPEEQIPSQRLFILTQERLQAILYNWKVTPHFDLLVVDESQKIGDKKRGIILEDSIIELITAQENLQVIFLSPLASNPSFLFELVTPSSQSQSLHTAVSPVAQHVYSVKTSTGKKGKLSISRIRPGSEAFIVDIETKRQIPTRKAERIAFVAKLLSNGTSSILYSNGPDEVEKNALALARSKDLPIAKSPEILETIESLRDFVHEKYYLIDCLQKRVGYHYGSMPDIARVSVEDLFKTEAISYIACTSTLLEGVNLPAKNIFIDTPKLGNEPMDDSSFWNLAGRAGRLMKDLAGNVYCINPSKWERPVLERSREYKIESSLNTTINTSTFVNYCQTLTLEVNAESCEQAANNLVLRYMEKGEETTRKFLEKRTQATNVNQLIKNIALLVKSITLPLAVLKKNKSIDIRFQQKFADYLYTLNDEVLIGLIPKQPLKREYQFYNYLLEVFDLCDRYFTLKNRRKKYRYFAVIAAQWIREESLKSMINSAIDYKKAKNDSKTINKIIRELIHSLNNEVRFHYVRSVKCFCDLLQYELDRRNIPYLDFPYVDFGLPNYLELGMCQKGTIQLHGLGLSRTTSIEINRYCRGRGVPSDAIVGWVRERTNEISRVIARPCRIELLKFFS